MTNSVAGRRFEFGNLESLVVPQRGNACFDLSPALGRETPELSLGVVFYYEGDIRWKELSEAAHDRFTGTTTPTRFRYLEGADSAKGKRREDHPTPGVPQWRFPSRRRSCGLFRRPIVMGFDARQTRCLDWQMIAGAVSSSVKSSAELRHRNFNPSIQPSRKKSRYVSPAESNRSRNRPQRSA
ncbi:hypothetical protein EC9_33160 [Rosistilla ulvae]|uniref:Uncharacterized protein n=1 Tax=Rosistilla ulvae TaxID=1930277 RepID=A0A517M2P0_9BACT|nr:hypothetical protein EC9_33160 [Rosistilla ulvae]